MQSPRRRFTVQAAFLSTLCLAGACSDSSSSGDTDAATAGDAGDVVEGGAGEGGLTLNASEDVPFGIDDVQFATDVSCGDYDETVFDIILPESDEPTPLIVFIHGGGFAGGSKDEPWDTREAEVTGALEAGVAMASITYRFLDEIDTEGVLKPLGDSRRCLQTLRYHADQLNIDPERIALMGTSAGAGTALWLGFHDEMADPDSDDPIEQESTRVSALAIWETQATYDILLWGTDVYPAYNQDVVETAALIGAEQRLLSFYAVTSIEALQDPETIEYRNEVDMLQWMDASDSPFWVENSRAENARPLSSDVAFHHPRHAVRLKEQADEVGLENVTYAPLLDVVDPSGETAIEFVLRHLDV